MKSRVKPSKYKRDIYGVFGRDSVTTEEVKLKLTAILSADVKAYSRLMGEDGSNPKEVAQKTFNDPLRVRRLTSIRSPARLKGEKDE